MLGVALSQQSQDVWSLGLILDFEHCKSEVEDYLQKSQDYIQCLQNNINNAANEANEVVKQFNCKASGKSYCY